jgi:hypothetical protein
MSRDMDSALFDIGTNLLAQAFLRDQIDRFADTLLKEIQ